MEEKQRQKIRLRRPATVSILPIFIFKWCTTLYIISQRGNIYEANCSQNATRNWRKIKNRKAAANVQNTRLTWPFCTMAKVEDSAVVPTPSIDFRSWLGLLLFEALGPPLSWRFLDVKHFKIKQFLFHEGLILGGQVSLKCRTLSF